MPTISRVLQANFQWMSVLQLTWVSLVLAWIMLWLACLQLALNDGNGNTIQSSRPTVYILPLVWSLHFTLSQPFTPVSSLQSTFYLQPAFCPWSRVCILHFMKKGVLKKCSCSMNGIFCDWWRGYSRNVSFPLFTMEHEHFFKTPFFIQLFQVLHTISEHFFKTPFFIQ